MKTRVFFYGSFMDTQILAKNRLYPKKLAPASLRGWEIGFTPYATLFSRKGSAVWGLICLLPREDLDRVYSHPLFSSHKYFPEAVTISTSQGKKLPALAYISYKPVGCKPKSDYLDILIRVAEANRYPQGYLKKLKSFYEHADIKNSAVVNNKIHAA